MEVSGRKEVKMDAFQKSQLCDPCNIDYLHEESLCYCINCNEFLCGNCANNHKKSKASRNHKLLDKDAMPSDKMASVRVKFCPKHKDEIINYFCSQHNAYCCSVCATQDHKHCDIQYMNDVAESEEYKGLLHTINDLESEVTDRIHKAKKTKVKVDKLFDQLQASIHQFKTEINVKLDTIERLAMSEAEQIKTDDSISMECTLTLLGTIKNGLQDVSSNLKSLEKYQQNKQLFISAKQAQTQVNEYVQELDEMLCQNNGIREYTFKPSEETMYFLNSFNLWTLEITKLEVGTLDNNLQMKREEIQSDGRSKGRTEQSEEYVNVQTNSETTTLYTRVMLADAETQSEKTRNKMDTKSLMYLRRINTEHESDGAVYQLRNDCWNTGIELLDIDTIALADHENNSIKIVDLNSDTIMSCCKLDEQPHDLTSIYQTRIIVTCDRELVFLLLNTWTLSIEKRLPVEPGCRGITYHNDSLFLTFVGEQARVELLDLSGNVLRVFANDDAKPKAFIDPQYIAISTDGLDMFISDHVMNSVTIMDMKGNLKSIYEHEDLKYPTGLVQDDKGAINVAGKTTNNIHRFSQQCSPIQISLDTFKWPQALAYSGINNRLYITQCASSFISVFKLE